MDTRASEIVVEKPSKPKRRWFQFNLRTLLLIMLVFGSGMGWVVSERQKNARRQAGIKAIRDLGGFAMFDVNKHVRATWLQWLLGDNSFRNVTGVFLNNTEITNAGLEHFKGFSEIEWLALAETKITDAGLEHLKGLTQLRELNLEGTEITDAGLEHLKGFTQLEELCVHDTEITNAGLLHLKGFTQLERLELSNTNITETGLADLKKTHPKCHIVK